MKDIFYDVDLNDCCNDRCNYHVMSLEHTEVLGQFLDRTAMTPDQLKETLIRGWLYRINLNNEI